MTIKKRLIFTLFSMVFLVFLTHTTQAITCSAGTWTYSFPTASDPVDANCFKIGDGNCPFLVSQCNGADNFCTSGKCTIEGLCGASGHQSGHHSVELGVSPIIVRTPYLPASTTYEVVLDFRRGSPGQNAEDFKVVCGGQTIPDLDIDDVSQPYIWRQKTFNCNFNEGINQITIEGTGTNSVHFESFSIEGCIPNPPTCGNTITDAGEACDEGSALNGQPGHCNSICTGINPPSTTEVPIATLPFFTFPNLIISSSLIALIYLFIQAKTSKKKQKLSA